MTEETQAKIEGWNRQTKCPRCGGWAYAAANTEREVALIAVKEAEVIRAFVERVQGRIKADYRISRTDNVAVAYEEAMIEEHNAMEKGNE